jgi:hypothetical protein
MSISRIKNFTKEPNDIFAGYNFASGYVLHKHSAEFSPALILEANKLIYGYLHIALTISECFHHRGKCLIFPLPVRDDVEDGGLHCRAEILEGLIKSLTRGVQLHEISGRFQEREKSGALFVEISDFFGQNCAREVVWGILREL